MSDELISKAKILKMILLSRKPPPKVYRGGFVLHFFKKDGELNDRRTA